MTYTFKKELQKINIGKSIYDKDGAQVVSYAVKSAICICGSSSP